MLQAHRKKIIGGVVAVALVVIGRLFGVDLSALQTPITDQVDHAVVEGQAQQSLPGFTFGP